MAISAKPIFAKRKLLGACGSVLLSAFAGSATATTEQWIPLTRVVSPTPVAGAGFGTAVAMSDRYLVIGEPNGTESGLAEAGRAYVYIRNGDIWTLWDTLVQVEPEAGAHFGASAAISGDNILVGAPDYDTFNPTFIDIGITYFYRRNTVSGHFNLLFGGLNVPAGAHSGYSVAVGATHAVIGAPGAAVGSNMQAGMATTWGYVSGSWEIAPTINADVPVAGAKFGASVALYEPASPAPALLAVGSPGFNAANVGGSVFVFGYGAGGWSQSQRLLEQGESADDNFGISVAIAGNRVFGGSINRNNPGGNDLAGSVTAFSGSLGNFTQEDELFSTNGSGSAFFGQSISLYIDGTVSHVLVGAPLANQSASVINSGAVFAFKAGTPPHAWTQQDRLSLGANAADNDELGMSIATFGTFAAAGAPQRDVGTVANAGIVQIYSLDTIFADDFE